MSDNIIEVLMDNDDLTVLAPPSQITLSYDIGPVGRRGGMWFFGSGLPNELTIPDYNELITNDLYVDSATGNIYQYILLPSNVEDWAYVGKVGGGPAGGIPVVMGDQQPTGQALWVDTTGGNLTLNIVTEN